MIAPITRAVRVTRPRRASLARAAGAMLMAWSMAGLATACEDRSDEPRREVPPDDGVPSGVTPGGRPDFCLNVQCPSGTICNEAVDACDPASATTDFCALVRCPAGTICNEQADSCDPLGSPTTDACSLIVCPDGTVCNQLSGSCEQSSTPTDFCSTIVCPPGTVCNEQNDSCQAF